MIEQYCAGKTPDVGFGEENCCNGGTINRGGKFYCWSHDPKGQEKRDIAAAKQTISNIRAWKDNHSRIRLNGSHE